MTRWLLNSAVLAAGEYGTYEFSPATVEDLKAFVDPPPESIEMHMPGVEPLQVRSMPISRIGYAETAGLIESWTGVRPTLSREPSRMAPGDEAMVVRLRYRVDPTKKGTPTGSDESDWEIAKLRRLA